MYIFLTVNALKKYCGLNECLASHTLLPGKISIVIKISYLNIFVNIIPLLMKKKLLGTNVKS